MILLRLIFGGGGGGGGKFGKVEEDEPEPEEFLFSCASNCFLALLNAAWLPLIYYFLMGYSFYVVGPVFFLYKFAYNILLLY